MMTKKELDLPTMKQRIIEYLSLMEESKMNEGARKYCQVLLVSFMQFCEKVEKGEEVKVKGLTNRKNAIIFH